MSLDAPRPTIASTPPRASVLYVIWSLQAGGAERVVADLARSVDRERFRPLVCCLNFKGQLAAPLEAEGIPVHVLDKRPKADLRALVRLVRLMRRERVDVVHTHLWTSSFWGRLAAILAGVPVRVVTEHNLDLWRRAPHWLADRVLARVTDRFVFVSAAVEAFYRERLSLPPERCRVVLNGVERPALDRFPDRKAARARLGIEGEGPVVGCVGRLEERKGHAFLLEALRRVAEHERDVRGLIVGTGKEAARLAALRDQLELSERVRLVGYWPDLAEALAAIDVFVLPSLMEGHPLAVLEAMAAAKPIVATAVGGLAEAIDDGRSGLLVPPGDADALAEAVVSLLRDPEKAARLGREARRSLEDRFSLEKSVRANEEVYRSALAERANGGGRR
jgi:glycosyltransferase involved in cell wall biosynthesis